MDPRPRLFLIDGHSYLYRAYFAIRNLSTSKGLPTNAIYGFTTMLIKILREMKPDYVAIAFDAEGPTLRHQAYDAYKAQRPEMPEPLQAQIPYVHRVVEAFRIPVVIREGYEADDLIGTLAGQATERGFTVTIVSGDKDMFQLITPHVRVFDSMKDRVYGESEIQERFGVRPDQMAEIMGLMGDSIDNIPGVPGIGEKTAVELIRRFGSIENLLGRIDEVERPKLRMSLRSFSEQARLSRRLAEIHRNCPIALEPDQFKHTEPDSAALLALYRELEFGSLLREVEVPAETKSAPVEIIETDSSLLAMATQCRSASTLGLDFWTRSIEGRRREILGIGLALPDRAYYLPLAPLARDGSPGIDPSRLSEHLGPLLTAAGPRMVIYDIKSALVALQSLGLTLGGSTADPMIASYLLNPNRRDHTLSTLALERLGARLPDWPDSAGMLPPAKTVAAIAGERASASLRLDALLMQSLRDQDLTNLFESVEMPLAGVLAQMELIGFKIDTAILGELGRELEVRLVRLSKRIYTLAGMEFNLNSPKQLAVILFERLGLKPIKKTKTGYSTSEEVLQQLAPQHELPAEVLNYRQLSKLKSTYADALPLMVDSATSRLHTTLNQTATATGRLSSSDPNLQNIPVKGELGQRFRRAFIPEKGFLLLSADYSQVELRILAHLSRDENLLAAFSRDEDVHTRTATQIFGLKPAEITPEMRRVAKTVNFGIIYGISPFGLSSTLGISSSEAKDAIERYLNHFSGVRRFISATLADARANGFVTTLLGRRRPIPELAGATPALRGIGERAAINTPIQGSAADLIKLAMIRIARRLKEEGRRSRMLLQIHDELLFEVPVLELEEMKRLVRHEMEGVMNLSAPLKVDIGAGANWNEAHV